jgi:hypothetical protein
LNSVERAPRGLPDLQLKLSLVGIADIGAAVPLVLPVRDGAIPDALAAAAHVAGFTGKPA